MMGDGRRVHNQTGQCPALPSPVIGSFKVVAGDGTSVGTVIRLQCPSRHRAVHGSQISCVWSINNTHWSGGTPGCKPISRGEDKGFQLALLMSFISFAIILLMSIIFITSCLGRHVKREERKKMERTRNRQAVEFWPQMDNEGTEHSRENHQKIRNNNNNNNNNNNINKEETRHVGTSITTYKQNCTPDDLNTPDRCHLQENVFHQCIHPSQLFQRDLCLNADGASLPEPSERHHGLSFSFENNPFNPFNFCAQCSEKEPLWHGHERPAHVESMV